MAQKQASMKPWNGYGYMRFIAPVRRDSARWGIVMMEKGGPTSIQVNGTMEEGAPTTMLSCNSVSPWSQ